MSFRALDLPLALMGHTLPEIYICCVKQVLRSGTESQKDGVAEVRLCVGSEI